MRYCLCMITRYRARVCTRFYRAILDRARYCYSKSSVRLFVCLSVTLRYPDHIGWKSSKIISRLVSLGCSLFADLNITDLFQGEHHEILARIGKGYIVSKKRLLAYKNSNISETRQDRTKVTIEVQQEVIIRAFDWCQKQ